MKHSSLKDIAKLAGVSESTVSRALRDNPKIRKSTRETVQKIAQKLNYQPNAFAVGLANKRNKPQLHQGNLLLLVGQTEEKDPIPQRPTYQYMLNMAKLQAEKYGYKLDYLWAHNPQYSTQRLKKIIHTRNISGIITLSLSIDEIELDWSNYALVRCAKSYPNEKCQIHYTTYHLWESILLALNKIKELGFSKIGFIVNEFYAARFYGSMISSFHNAHNLVYQREATIPLLLQKEIEPEFTLFKDWYHTYKPEVILSFYNSSQINKWLQRLSLSTPQDVGYVDLALSPNNTKLITGTQLPYKQFASSAVDLIVSQLHAHQKGIPEANEVKGIYLYPSWNTGTSLVPQ